MGGHPRTQDSQFTVVWGQRGSEGPKVLLGLGDAGASSPALPSLPRRNVLPACGGEGPSRKGAAPHTRATA